MRFGTVCSGIGAPEAAWTPRGWTPVFASEIEAFPSAVLAHRYPDTPNLGDMTRFEEWPDAALDVLCGGTPCQDYSVAGRRLGMAGSRGQLSLTFVEIAARYRPGWIVWENVPGVLSSNGGRDFARFLGDLSGTSIEVPDGGWRNSGIVAGIPDAYGLAFRVLDVQFCRTRRFPFAIPQRRRRVFVVGHLGDWRRPAAVLFDAASVSGNPPPRREAGQGAAGTFSARAEGGGGFGTDFEASGGLIAAYGGGRSGGPVDAAACLTAKGQRVDFEVETFVAHALTSDGFDASQEAGSAGGTTGTREIGTGRGTPLVTAFSAKDHGGDASEGVSPTIRSGIHDKSHPNAGVMPAIAAGASVRRLTVLECERLFGFPDGYTAIPAARRHRAAEEADTLEWLIRTGQAADADAAFHLAADGPRYRALGNSIGLNVLDWLAERIETVEALAGPGCPNWRDGARPLAGAQS